MGSFTPNLESAWANALDDPGKHGIDTFEMSNGVRVHETGGR